MNITNNPTNNKVKKPNPGSISEIPFFKAPPINPIYILDYILFLFYSYYIMYYPLLFYNMMKIIEFNNWYWNEYYPFCIFSMDLSNTQLYLMKKDFNN